MLLGLKSNYFQLMESPDMVIVKGKRFLRKWDNWPTKNFLFLSKLRFEKALRTLYYAY